PASPTRAAIGRGRKAQIAAGPPAPGMPEDQPIDLSGLASPIPPGRRFVIRQITAIGWNTWLYFPDAEPPVWTDVEFNPVTPPPGIRETGERHVRGQPP